MLDHGKNWDAVPDWSSAALDLGGVKLRCLEIAETALISGNLMAFGQATGLDAEGAGAFGSVTGERYTVRLARDRLLLVGDLPESIHESWNEAGFAVSLTGGMDHVFLFSGERLSALLARATSLDPAAGSRSAMLGFAGIPAIAYHHLPTGDLRLHVDRSQAAYLWTWLKALGSEDWAR